MPRPGAYCVLFDDRRIAAVSVKGKLILPGGGIEPGESARGALVRELKEETGLVPIEAELFAHTLEYMWSLSGTEPQLIESHLFVAHVHTAGEPAVEEDHELVRVPVERAADDLLRSGQRWAVARAARGEGWTL